MTIITNSNKQTRGGFKMIGISYLGFCALGALTNPKLSHRVTRYGGVIRHEYYYNRSMEVLK